MDPAKDKDRVSIGWTGNMVSHAWVTKLVWVPPLVYLKWVDPSFLRKFGDTTTDSYPWLMNKIEEGAPFAPLVAYPNTVDEFTMFPKEPLGQRWVKDRYIGKMSPESRQRVFGDEAQRKTMEDLGVTKIIGDWVYSTTGVRSHEGRHRAVLAHKLGEARVPVIVILSNDAKREAQEQWADPNDPWSVKLPGEEDYTSVHKSHRGGYPGWEDDA
jgi:hypothetical protein